MKEVENNHVLSIKIVSLLYWYRLILIISGRSEVGYSSGFEIAEIEAQGQGRRIR
jgi:hypothetical protein